MRFLTKEQTSDELKGVPEMRSAKVISGPTKILLLLLSVLLFSLPGAFLYSLTLGQIGQIAAVLALFTAVFYLLPRLGQLTAKPGLWLVIIGVVLWQVGWVLMRLLNEAATWHIFVTGWLLLSIGFCLITAANIQAQVRDKRFLFLSILGLLPALVELTTPFHFVTQFSGSTQLGVMLLYTMGWVILGILIRPRTTSKSKPPT